MRMRSFRCSRFISFRSDWRFFMLSNRASLYSASPSCFWPPTPFAWASTVRCATCIPRRVTVLLQELLRLAVSESDGTASDILLRVLGGPVLVDRYIRSLGVQGIAVVDTEKT